jgi:hypothetical protein
MSELLIGTLIGFAICCAMTHLTEARYGRRQSDREPEGHSAMARQKAVVEELLANATNGPGQSRS